MSRKTISWKLGVHALCTIVTVLAVATWARADSRLALTIYGSVTSVDPALGTTFHTGDPFQIGFTIDPAEYHPSIVPGRSLYYKVGASYTAVASPYGTVGVNYSDGLLPTRQGFYCEHHEMIAPLVNGFQVSDSYFNIALFLGTPPLTREQLLALNGQPVLNSSADTGLSYDFDPPSTYKYVRLHPVSISVVEVPEPESALVLATVVLISNRRRGEGKRAGRGKSVGRSGFFRMRRAAQFFFRSFR